MCVQALMLVCRASGTFGQSESVSHTLRDIKTSGDSPIELQAEPDPWWLDSHQRVALTKNWAGKRARCTALPKAAVKVQAANRKAVALILRGQAFRDWAQSNYDSTCCSQSYIAQREVFWSHRLMWEQLEQSGYEVDFVT